MSLYIPYDWSDRLLWDVIVGSLPEEPGRFLPQFRWRAQVLETIRRSQAPQRILTTGSWSHGTAIAGFSDRDYFLVFKGAPADDPTKVLADLHFNLSISLSSSTDVELDPPVVSVTDPYTNVVLEFVPAFVEAGPDYLIPDSLALTWIPSDPVAHITYLSEADEASRGAREVVRLLKAWKCFALPEMSSLYLEMVTAQYALTTPRLHYVQELAGVLTALARGRLEDVQDPSVEQARRLSAFPSRQVEVRDALKVVEKSLDLAHRIEAADKWRAKEAVRTYVDQLFGGQGRRRFPARHRVLRTRRDPNQNQFRGSPPMRMPRGH